MRAVVQRVAASRVEIGGVTVGEIGQGLMILLDIGGEALVVSQFTLYADCKKGNRPSFIAAGRPEISEPLYESFVHELIALGVEKVATGQFGADMQVYIQNDGPVTIVLDTDEIMPKRVTVRKAGAKENA